MLQRHAAQHPSGQLTEERQAARAVALCRAGRREEGLAVALQFARTNPDSMLLPRVQAVCASPSGEPGGGAAH